ncbi:unnamed protein product [Leptosia nina]|uniref:Uncharacterized protein n=1 Tax=Leptosia nina TaxID=320188 RepID=A0AAV1JT46_9NEOP
MFVKFALIFLFLHCASTYEERKNYIDDDYKIYENWPFKYNIPHLIHALKRDVNTEAKVEIEKNVNTKELEKEAPKQLKDLGQTVGHSEGGVVNQVPVVDTVPDVSIKSDMNTLNEKPVEKLDTTKELANAPKGNNDTKANATDIQAQPISKVENKPLTHNDTSTEPIVDINSPGVVKRGLIVFGGLTLLAVAYFIFYRNKHKKFDAANAHGTGDQNQFRYGVLHSDDRRENLELSRIPLTMESDDDEDEDLEIFDLEQKRKSMSYVNLQVNDEDIVLRSSKDESKNNLLLDIEDGSADQLINWSGSGSKSIL